MTTDIDRNEIVTFSSTLVRVRKLFDKGAGVSGEYIDDATVTATIYDTDGTTPLVHEDDTAVGWPVTLPFVVGTRGQYQTTVLKPLKVVQNESYRVVIDATRPSGVTRRFVTWVPASEV